MKIKYVLFAIVVCSACTQRSPISEYSHPFPVETIVVDLDKFPDSEGLELRGVRQEQITNDFWVQLETLPECLLGNIDQMQVFRNKIYVLDRSVANGLYVFDMKGKFLYQAGRKGKGPGEYYQISQFYIDSVKNAVTLLDAEMKKIHRYNLENGRFLEAIQLDKSYYVNSGIVFDSSAYAFDQIYVNPRKGKRQYHLNFFVGDSIFGFKPLKDGHFLPNKIPFTVSSGKVFYTPIRCDTIFEIDKSGIKRGIYIDFGVRALPQKYLEMGFSKEDSKTLQRSKYAINLRNVVETPRYFCFSVSLSSSGRFVLIDKLTKNTYTYFNFSALQPSFFLCAYGNYLVSERKNVVNFYNSIPENVQVQMDSLRTDEFKKIIREAKEGDNPALYFVDLNL